ncbi:S-layer family protein [Oxynema sp. CENA135]|uniref:beta strand repeat-containing protein n=1 Tax=Oxynema sp. CENA135 TaxID=984206 RepID=UPI00190D52AE|nr:S-layer family protein [Oxynema sp. CENA135]MBK4731585.1 S-layer family protein [Oxynema sp. CENA135]
MAEIAIATIAERPSTARTMTQTRGIKPTRALRCLAVAIAALSPIAARAQVIPDGSLPENSLVIPEGNLTQIRGGTQAGNNLFHSFKEFSVGAEGVVWFDHAAGITNILTRVTGGKLSQIDGTIRANPGANLFLLNPSGIVFGANARLEIGGSFLATTGDRLLFDDGSSFSATDTSTPALLTVAVPTGIQFVNDGQSPASLTVLGPGNRFGFGPLLETVRDDRPTGFAVPPGQTLALLGDRIDIAGGNLTAEDGQIELGSVRTGTVTFGNENAAFGYNVREWGDTRLSGAASVDASGDRGGKIQVRARHLAVLEGSSILADTLGDGPGQTVKLQTSESIEFSGLTPGDGTFSSSAFASVAPGASGNGGQLLIETDRLRVLDGSIVGVDTFGAGNGGLMSVKARDVETRTSFWSGSSFVSATGTGGTIAIESDRLRVLEGAQILSFTRGEGNAGEVILRARESIEVSGAGVSFGSLFASVVVTTVEVGSTGRGGNLTVETGRLIVADGGAISTETNGTDPSSAAGVLSITATESIDVFGQNEEGLPSAISTNANFDAPGADLTIETGRLRVADGGQIGSGSFGAGNGGTLTIRVNGPIALSGSAAELEFRDRLFFTDDTGTRFPSGLFASSQGAGNAGNLTIEAQSFSADNRAEVTVSSSSTGEAGSLELIAETVDLDNQALLRADNSAGLGNISLSTGDLRLRGNSQISTNARGIDDGGNLTIATQNLVALDNSDITANAVNSAGGRISISAEGIFGTELRSQPTAASDITASSELGANFSGEVRLETPEFDPRTGFLKTSPQLLSAYRLQLAGCAAPEQNQFTITGSGGLPENPIAPIRAQSLWDDLRDIPEESNASPLTHESDRPVRTTSAPPTLEATGWVTDDTGRVELVASGSNRVNFSRLRPQIADIVPACP